MFVVSPALSRVSRCVSKRSLKFSSRSPTLCCVVVPSIPFTFNFTPAGYFLPRPRLLHFLFHCHAFFVFFPLSPLLTIISLSHIGVGVKYLCYGEKKTNPEKKQENGKFAPEKNRSEAGVTELCWSTAGVTGFSSAPAPESLSSCLPPRCSFTSSFVLLCSMCGPQLTRKATRTSKRTLFLFNAFQNGEKKKHFANDPHSFPAFYLVTE